MGRGMAACWSANFCDRFFLLAGVIPCGALVLAFFLEYVVGIKPCQFCLYERWVYAAIAFVSVGWIIGKSLPRRYGVLAVALLLLVGIAVTGVHVGIERGWISEHLCAVSDISYDELLESLQDWDDGDERMPSCAKVPFVFLGLSLAEHNLLFLIACFVCTVSACRRAFCGKISVRKAKEPQ